jgi:hypothetical protein
MDHLFRNGKGHSSRQNTRLSPPEGSACRTWVHWRCSPRALRRMSSEICPL